jgi:hypothetical protein
MTLELVVVCLHFIFEIFECRIKRTNIRGTMHREGDNCGSVHLKPDIASHNKINDDDHDRERATDNTMLVYENKN